MMRLSDLKAGEEGVVSRVDGKGALRDRLLDMGITPGTKVMLRKLAPLGDPMEITLRGYELTLRRSDAHEIHLREDHPRAPGELKC